MSGVTRNNERQGSYIKRVQCDQCSTTAEAAESLYGTPPEGWLGLQTFKSTYGDATKHFCSPACATKHLETLPIDVATATEELAIEPPPAARAFPDCEPELV